MNIAIREPSPSSGQVSWKLFDTFDVQKGIREKGGVIDFTLTLEDAEYWVSHPEEFPEELKNQTTFLWSTFGTELGFRRIALLFWFTDEVLLWQHQA
jgi:hypothetical protein